MEFYHSPLFLAVQQSALFEDSKTFADALPKTTWLHVCSLYEQQQPSADELANFVANHFTFASKPELEPLGKVSSVSSYIHTLWKKLARPPTPSEHGSLLALAHPYTVPGGRFNEVYYWDTYFTALGLIDQGDIAQVASMLDNFIDLIDQFGHVPNGNRSYYVSRSQPPVCALIVDLLWPYYHTNELWVARVGKALEREYAFWMAPLTATSGGRTVTMPCGTTLNRYWDNDPSPRPESYREDVHEAARFDSEHQQHFYRHIRAACESGWDFSSRWLKDPADLQSIRTCDIVPVDLNALMWQLEQTLTTIFAHQQQEQKAIQFRTLAKARQQGINAYLWDQNNGLYVDWVISAQTQSKIHSLATTAPLFVGLCTKAQAQRISDVLTSLFLRQGGLVTTAIDSTQQWDSPNGWAPLQWFAVSGLMRYGLFEPAFEIISRWLNMIEHSFSRTGCLLEKYNVCDPDALAGGGEYRVQQGFGWTNGVTSRFYQLQQAEHNTGLLTALYQANLPIQTER